jgi:hypothetical protein
MGDAKMDSLPRLEGVMKRSVLASLFAITIIGCASGKCLQSANAEAAAAKTTPSGTSTGPANGANPTMKPESKLDRVKVFKPDGSLQCGQGKAKPVADMQKELGDIQVFSSFNKNDGMMRIQVCGSPTGNANVYEIDRKNLEAALKKGFKEWTFDN